MERRFTLQKPMVLVLWGCAILVCLLATKLEAQQQSTPWHKSVAVGQRLAPAGTGQANLFTDDFNASTLNSKLWSFVDPLGDATLGTNGKQVMISVPESTAHDAWSGANNAPRILQPASDGDFEIIAKIDSPMTKQYQTSGIMVQESPATYLRFDINTDGSSLHAFAASVANNVATAQNDIVLDAGVKVPLYIAVKRTGNNWQMAWSKDDTTWNLSANFNVTITVNAVGLFAANQGTTPPAFTAAFDFFYSGTPVQPEQISPSSGAINVLVPTVVTWGAFPGAATYRLQVGTDPTFASGIVVHDSTITDTTRSLASLSRGVQYYWRVAARNAAGGTSGWSAVWSFTTAPPAPATPALIFPADAAGDIPTSVRLVWSKSSAATSYQVQAAEDSLFAGGFAVNDSAVTDTAKNLAGLKNSTRYFWRVRAFGVGGASAYASVRRFTTVVAPPGAPSLVSPVAGTVNLPSSVTFVWTRVAGAAQYHLQIAPDTLFISGLVINDSTITDSAKNVAGLSLSSQYYWRVRARNAGGGSAYTAPWGFTTIVGAPAQYSPTNGAGGQPLTVTLRWGKVARAIAYRLQMGTDSTFVTGVIKNDSTITDTSRAISGLVINQRYYWRVSARDASGSGPFSPTWWFLTATPLPDPFALVSPANNVSLTTDTVVCVWRSTQPLIERYTLEYAADSLFVFKIVDSTLTDTTKVLRGLLANTRYFWRVRAKNPGGWGAYTAYWAFRAKTTDVVDGRPLPQEFGLSQNYPNPFNPTTRIEYALPRESRITLEVFNLLGERVGVLDEGVKPAGYHVAVLDAVRWPSGIYLYRLSVDAGGPTFVRRMVVVK